MDIYFAGAIRGGGDDRELYKKMIEHLKKHGDVIGGEHADNSLMSKSDVEDDKIHKRDKQRLVQADVLVAEVTTPSLGVGYEIGVSEGKKKILCLYRQEKLSAMIAGTPFTTAVRYRDLEDAKKKIDEFFANIR